MESWQRLGYQLLPEYAPKDIIEEIIEISNLEHRYTRGEVGPDGFSTMNKNIRSVDLINLDCYEHPDIYGMLKHVIEVFNARYLCYNISGINQIDLLRYGVGGHYIYHDDVFAEPTPTDRKISCILQLSDPSDYEGGDFVLEGEDIDDHHTKMRRAKGSIVLFDSRLSHRISPVTSGERKSLIAWGVGRV